MGNALLERVFFAIDPIQWKSVIEKWQKKLIQQFSEINQTFYSRPSISTHLTLLFLGEQNTGQIELINQYVSEMPFDSRIILRAKNLGLLHSHVVIFLERDNLNDLHELLVTRVRHTYINLKNDHSFLPRITLGKIQYPVNDEKVIKIFSAFNVEELESHNISYFNLYRSFPGNHYEILQKYHL